MTTTCDWCHKEIKPTMGAYVVQLSQAYHLTCFEARRDYIKEKEG